jgi:subtilisin
VWPVAERVPPAVRRQAETQGAAPVIVVLDPGEVPAARSDDSVVAASRLQGIANARSRMLRAVDASDRRVVRTYRSFPLVALEATAKALAQLANAPAVVRVFEDRARRLALTESVPLVEADQAWLAGYDGDGWAVAVLDSGVDGTHPMLAGRLVDEACFSRDADCPNGQTSDVGPGAASTCSDAPACQHGTYIAGIVAGHSASRSGVAPGASIIAVKVTSSTPDGPVVYDSDQLAGLDYVNGLRDRFAVAAVNLSFAGNPYASQEACDAENQPSKTAIGTLRAAGIATVVAAGNGGLVGSITAPACVSSAVSVGCTTDSDAICSISNSAPFLSLWAPGADIVSSIPSGGFGVATGTSASAAHVSGAWAILKQVAPSASVEDVLASLRASGAPIEPAADRATRVRIWHAAKLLACGNGRLDLDEECDDGNHDEGDYCHADCTLPVAPQPCTGDCDGNAAVTIDDLLKLVLIANEEVRADACLAGDADGSGTIDIGDILRAVDTALNGCE